MKTREITLSQLFQADLPETEGLQVTVATVTAGAGTSPKHYHPGHSFTYVLEGSQLHESENEQVISEAGDVIYDAPMQVHRTENNAPVKLLVIRILEKGSPEIIVAP